MFEEKRVFMLFHEVLRVDVTFSHTASQIRSTVGYGCIYLDTIQVAYCRLTRGLTYTADQPYMYAREIYTVVGLPGVGVLSRKLYAVLQLNQSILYYMLDV